MLQCKAEEELISTGEVYCTTQRDFSKAEAAIRSYSDVGGDLVKDKIGDDKRSIELKQAEGGL